MEEFYYNKKIIRYRLIKKDKKNLSIIIKNNEVFVYAPIALNKNIIEKILLKKADWIFKNINHLPNKLYIDGERIFYLGNEYELKILSGDKTDLIIRNNCIQLTINKRLNNPKELLHLWYKKQAKDIFYNRVNYYSSRLNVKVEGIKINDLNSAWGICYPNKRKITFNWRLIMAPIEIIDYVVVHELCHLIYPNHSILFWNEVESYINDYKIKRKWLKVNGTKLVL